MQGKLFKMLLILFLAVQFSFAQCVNKETIRKSKESHVYKTAVFGKQTWMIENLNVEAPGSYCYDNLNKNCKTHGRLYTWKAAQKACPKGWRLPDKEEFAELVEFLKNNPTKKFNPTLGGQRVCFNGKDVWNDYCESATSIGVPGGTKINFAYEGLNEKSYFWTSSEEMAHIAHFWEYDGESQLFTDGALEENFAYSVRCIKR